MRLFLMSVVGLTALFGARDLALAFTGQCFLLVKGHVYLDGACPIDVDSDGSFSIGAGENSHNRHFAYVTVDSGGGAAEGFWNGVDAASHAHDPLGKLTRQGGCWSNAGAKVCAWKNGTRPAAF